VPFTVDASDWPLLLLRPMGRCSQPEWAAGWAEAGRAVRGGEGPFVILADAREAEVPDAVQRAVVSSFFRDHEDVLRRSCRGMAVVVRNPVVRAAATAVFWVSKPVVPIRFERDLGAARAWAAASLDSALPRVKGA
jgi:hypothetical protein